MQRWFIVILLGFLCGCGRVKDTETVTQFGLINALFEGHYDGDQSVGELRRYGDLGLGTFDGLDGELVMLDGKIFRADVSGQTILADPSVTTPFATATFFQPDLIFDVDSMDYNFFSRVIDWKRPSSNRVYALKITGRFDSVHVRSVSRQTKPYLSLTEVTKTQSEHTFKDVEGTMVGFLYPSFFANINQPGYHLHFIDKELKQGGHVLDFALKRGRIELDETPNVRVMLPQDF